MSKNLGIDDYSSLQDGINALEYLILHIAKVKASEEEFYILYD